MGRYVALWRETWWLWLLMTIGGILMSFISLVFLVTLPIALFTFLWFGFVRFDADGTFKGS